VGWFQCEWQSFTSLAWKKKLFCSSIIVYFFTTKFHVDEGTLGNTFFTTSFVAAISNIVAGSLARRFGNIRTMAFTHLPSAILLALVPLPSNFQFARALLIAVFCTTKMDMAPRTAFLASYISAEERTAVMGIINVVKIFSQSIGPTVTGLFASHGKIWLSFVIAGVLQASYDLAMLYFFTTAVSVS
jgi:MFS family permease